jgi:hypothetical protein
LNRKTAAAITPKSPKGDFAALEMEGFMEIIPALE